MKKSTANMRAIINCDKTFNRFNDAFVKFLFSTEKHKNFLIDLLNAVFAERRPPCVSGQVLDVTFADREMPPFHDAAKYSRLDIRALTDSGQMINIEVQSGFDKYLKDRNLFYFSKLFSEQLTAGMDYSQLKPVVIINLLAVNYFPTRKDYISSYSLHEDKDHELMTDKVNFIFIEAQKCQQMGDKNKSRLTRWMTYLTYPSSEVVYQLAQIDKIIAQVMEAETMFCSTPQEVHLYEAQEKLRLDMLTRERTAKAEGKAEGFAEGRSEGKAEGFAEGRTETLLEIISNLKNLGCTREQMKAITKLNDEQLAQLL